jgi:phage I-like protein
MWDNIISKFGKSRKIFNSGRMPKGYVANATAITDIGDGEWRKVLECGDYANHPDKGHVVDDAFLDTMVRNFRAMKRDLLVDVDHGSLAVGPDGRLVNTEAVGWAEDFKIENHALYMKEPAWVKPFNEKIQNKAYKFFSLVYVLNAKDRHGRSLGPMMDSVAVTNRPYMDTDEIRNNDQLEEIKMKYTDEQRKKLIAKFKLAETATDDELFAKINEAALADPTDADKAAAEKAAAEKAAAEKAAADKAAADKADAEKATADDPVANSAVIKEMLTAIKGVTETVQGLIKNSQADHATKIDQLVAGWKKAWQIPASEAEEKLIRNSLVTDFEGTVKAISARPVGFFKPKNIAFGVVKNNDQGKPDQPKTFEQLAQERAEYVAMNAVGIN